MLLILSHHQPIEATYRDAASGLAQYKVETPIKMHDLITTISRVIEGDIPQRDPSSAGVDSEKLGLLARISWHLVGLSVI
jgi:hypothetical protein